MNEKINFIPSEVHLSDETKEKLNKLLNDVIINAVDSSKSQNEIIISNYGCHKINSEMYDMLTNSCNRSYFVTKLESVGKKDADGKLATNIYEYFRKFVDKAFDNYFGRSFDFSKALKYSSNNHTKVTEGKKYMLYTSR